MGKFYPTYFSKPSRINNWWWYPLIQNAGSAVVISWPTQIGWMLVCIDLTVLYFSNFSKLSENRSIWKKLDQSFVMHYACACYGVLMISLRTNSILTAPIWCPMHYLLFSFSPQGSIWGRSRARGCTRPRPSTRGPSGTPGRTRTLSCGTCLFWTCVICLPSIPF